VAGSGIAIALALSTRAGWYVLGAAALMIGIVAVGGWRLDRRRRPELWVFFSTVVNIQFFLALGTVLVGGPRSGLAAMLAVPVLMVAARFSNRGLLIGAPISAVMIIAVTAGVDPGYVAAHPESIAVPLAIVLCTAMYLSPLVASDVRHRADSTLDALTGLLNRRALEPRFAEVAEQAALTDRPVSVVVTDIDHFKSINDRNGHAAGDRVLRETAAAMRRALRSFELLYRIGGDEFLLLLPGTGNADATEMAERLRRAVEELDPAGLDVTCSFGVATARGLDVAYAQLVGAADVALYQAKRGGRNRLERREGERTPVPA
jgi:diguanylate cyclase (GGDEF)-like protein